MPRNDHRQRTGCGWKPTGSESVKRLAAKPHQLLPSRQARSGLHSLRQRKRHMRQKRKQPRKNMTNTSTLRRVKKSSKHSRKLRKQRKISSSHPRPKSEGARVLSLQQKRAEPRVGMQPWLELSFTRPCCLVF